jgi:hypothetical protein
MRVCQSQNVSLCKFILPEFINPVITAFVGVANFSIESQTLFYRTRSSAKKIPGPKGEQKFKNQTNNNPTKTKIHRRNLRFVGICFDLNVKQ